MVAASLYRVTTRLLVAPLVFARGGLPGVAAGLSGVGGGASFCTQGHHFPTATRGAFDDTAPAPPCSMPVPGGLVAEWLPSELHTAADTRDNEAAAAAALGIDMYTLMKTAGRASFDVLSHRYAVRKEAAPHVVVVAGKGNNGGDGYVVAKCAAEAGWRVEVVQIGDPASLAGDAARARDEWVQACAASPGTDRQGQPPIKQWHEGFAVSPEADVVVDAIFGTGLARPVGKGPFADAIGAVMRSGKPVLAVDVPSGLSADTGQVLGGRDGIAIAADATVTFIGLKQGLVTGAAIDHVGGLYFAGLGVEEEFRKLVPATASRSSYAVHSHLLPPRPLNSHKGHFGKIVLVGGADGMPGAIRMAAEASQRVGAGLVRTVSATSSREAVTSGRPEIMASTFDLGDSGGSGISGDSGDALAKALEWASVLVVGPGMGQDAWGRHVWRAAMAAGKPMVMDADALNLLSASAAPKEHRDDWVLTPHPGEASRLLGITTADVERDRYAAARAIQALHGGVVLLKGPGTIICGPGQRCSVVNAGNPGMSTGGMGDVLSGIIGGLAAQHLPLFEAACLGASIHGNAADGAAAAYGERGLLATDLFPFVRRLVNPVRRAPRVRHDPPVHPWDT